MNELEPLGQNLPVQAHASLISINLSYFPSLHLKVYLPVLWPSLYTWPVCNTTATWSACSWLSSEQPTAGTGVIKDGINVKSFCEPVPGDR